MRKVKVLGFVSLAVWVLVPLLSAQWSAVYDSWSGGESTSGLPVWGMDMLLWGRVGKGVQFVAGLAVVLDLVGPERLREKGRAARRRLDAIGERSRRRQRGSQRHQEGDRLFEWLVKTVKEHRVAGARAVTYYERFLRPESDLRFQMAGFEEPELRQLAERVRTRFSPRLGELRDDQADEIRSEIASFLRLKYPDDADQMDSHATATSLLVGILTLVTALGLAAFTITALILARESSGPDAADASTATTMLCVLEVVVILLIPLFAPGGLMTGNPAATVSRLQQLVRLPWITILTTAAKLLDKTRPGNALRWIAFYLFLHGFALDLLAS